VLSLHMWLTAESFAVAASVLLPLDNEPRLQQAQHMSASVTESLLESISLGTFKVADSTVCTDGGTRPGIYVEQWSLLALLGACSRDRADGQALRRELAAELARAPRLLTCQQCMGHAAVHGCVRRRRGARAAQHVRRAGSGRLRRARAGARARRGRHRCALPAGVAGGRRGAAAPGRRGGGLARPGRAGRGHPPGAACPRARVAWGWGVAARRCGWCACGRPGGSHAAECSCVGLAVSYADEAKWSGMLATYADITWHLAGMA